jgi:subtilisin-like proprotein convertase family protein
MPEIKFGRKEEPATVLIPSKDLIAVRTRSTRSLTAGPVASPAAAELSGGQMVMAFPEAGVEVYRVPTGEGGRSVTERTEALRSLPDVRFAGGVLVDEASGEPMIYTENLFVKFVDDADPEHCRKVLREAGLAIKQEVDYATNAFFAAAPEGTGTMVFDIAQALLERDDVEYCHPEVVRRRSFRAIPVQQWHLRTTIVNGVQVSASVNVEAAHQATLGNGVTIAVIDDGVDIDHPEFNTAGKVVAPRDVTLRIDDPRPKDTHPAFKDNHGTACAGVACADGREGAFGVAPRARLMPIRLFSGLGSQSEAEAFRWAADHGADVISCSWGPADGDWFDPADPLHDAVSPLPASTRLAIDYATTQGRGGKGCVILFAAGNGNESVDNDGYASCERVIAVAACNDRGTRSVYSDFGNAVWCAFPSSDFGHSPFNHPDPLTPGIWTTDRTGTSGYNSGNPQLGDPAGNYTNRFGGTSSACPGAAGVAALILSVNPELRWHEVREILRQACDRIDPQGGQYDATGRSALYGHGRLNAARAVELARPAIRNRVRVSREFDQLLPDLQTVSVSLDVGEEQPIEDLSIHVEILHTYIGDLVVTLVPPSGAGIVLHDRKGGATRNLKRTFDLSNTPGLDAFKGRSAQGRWTLRVRDTAMRDEGRLVRYGLDLAVSAPAALIEAEARPQYPARRPRRANAA